MRARNIKPGFFKNEHLLSLDPISRLLFAGLWCMADREGRLEDRPLKIKIEVLPADNCDVDCLLSGLFEKRDQNGNPALINRYEVDKIKYIQIVNFSKHQVPHHREPPSTIPNSTESPGLAQGQTTESPGLAVLIPESPYLNPESIYPHSPLPGDGVCPADGNGKKILTKKQQALFDAFWKAYPKHKSKGQAEKAWLSINPGEQLLAAMVATIERAKTSEEWQREGGQYIPYPATWLRAKGWEDEFYESKGCGFDWGKWIETEKAKVENGKSQAS